MVIYEIKLKKIGEITTLPDSQRLFGFLINYSKKYCLEDEISSFVKEVKEQKQKCMISSVAPSGYYPTPKGYIMQKLRKRLEKNKEEIKKLEEKQINLKREIESYIQELIHKKKQRIKWNEKEKKKIKDLKSKVKQRIKEFNNIANCINDLSIKHIYETLKNMDFICQNQLKKLLELGKVKESIKVKDLLECKYIKKNQTFIQKFRLESQVKELPGMPNVAYSLSILSFINQNGENQKEFSFLVKVERESCISKALEGMKKSLNVDKIPCFLGGKGSVGYNEYQIYDIKKSSEGKDGKQLVINTNYLNLGVLLPNFDNIDIDNSILEIYTSDRKPFEIENEISKVISFVTTGSVIKTKENIESIYQIGNSIDNNKYNPLYKNSIIFGNSYLIKLERNDET